MRIGAHAPGAFGRKRLQFRDQPPVLVEQLLGLVAAQPVFQLLQMGRVVVHARQRHLVRPPEAFHLVAVHFLGTGPALGAAQHDHRPARPGRLAARARFLLNAPNFQHAVLQRRGHLLVHQLGIAALRRNEASSRSP